MYAIKHTDNVLTDLTRSEATAETIRSAQYPSATVVSVTMPAGYESGDRLILDGANVTVDLGYRANLVARDRLTEINRLRSQKTELEATQAAYPGEDYSGLIAEVTAELAALVI